MLSGSLRGRRETVYTIVAAERRGSSNHGVVARCRVVGVLRGELSLHCFARVCVASVGGRVALKRFSPYG
ncbi:hypothetical protein D7S86_03300 [Pararobbsia silviterrae]|uniref:Uncharacterized protein n=1 Tax=Pararobbsia silviterrae TaxID=1792498 RepID=A0A494YE11_9BURK|nr:hypothetical protein D7S86_03300 [Pararobbsia silviterrae]